MIDEVLVYRTLRKLKTYVNDPQTRKHLIGDYLMAMSNKEKQDEYKERMKEKGYTRAAVWLSPDSQKVIGKIQKNEELTRDKALEHLILKEKKVKPKKDHFIKTLQIHKDSLEELESYLNEEYKTIDDVLNGIMLGNIDLN